MRCKPIVYYVISCLFQIFLYAFEILKIKTQNCFTQYSNNVNIILYLIYLIILLTSRKVTEEENI